MSTFGLQSDLPLTMQGEITCIYMEDRKRQLAYNKMEGGLALGYIK
jgi:hypothetical protein